MAFNTPDGPFQSNILTFGLMNTPPHFQKFVNDHLYNKPEIINTILRYLNDTNIHTPNNHSHIPVVRKFLQLCREAGIVLNLKKCEFHKDCIDFLGVELSGDGFQMDTDKCSVIQEWKPPSKVRGVWEFIGFCNFYCCFIKGFVDIAQPLHNLTKNNHLWRWMSKEERAFQTLKDIVATSLVLSHPNPNVGYQMETNTSNYAYGAILSQKGMTDGKYHPIAFYLRSMNPME